MLFMILRKGCEGMYFLSSRVTESMMCGIDASAPGGGCTFLRMMILNSRITLHPAATQEMTTVV